MKRKFHQGAPVVGAPLMSPDERQFSGWPLGPLQCPSLDKNPARNGNFFFTCRFSPCSFVDRSNPSRKITSSMGLLAGLDRGDAGQRHTLEIPLFRPEHESKMLQPIDEQF
jgi:hypothetical protein